MKVGIIHPYFDIMGGAEMTSLSLIDALINNKIQTTLYCVKSPEIESPYLSIKKVKEKNIPWFWRLQKIIEIKQLFNLASKEDILFVTSGGLAIEKTDAKKIYVYCHSSFSVEKEFSERKIQGIKWLYLKIIQNSFKKRLAYLKNKKIKLISNSNFTKKEIEMNLGIKSLLIYPPVDINKFLEKNDIDKEQKIVTISRFSIEKNLEFVIEVFNKINFPCELIGNAKYKNQLKILEQLNTNKKQNVKIYNNISKVELMKILKSSKVYFHTSKETFGISVVESIAAGCIPIVPDNSAHKETVPFPELRYNENDINDAKSKIERAMNGEFDELLLKLFVHIKKFDNEIFQKNILELMK